MFGPAAEAGDHCFGVHKERGFLLRVPTDGRALPKWAPEMGVNCGYLLRPQRWAWNANAAAATKNPVCKCRSLPTLPGEPEEHATAWVPWSRNNFPRRTHGTSQAVAMLCWPLLLEACPTFQLWLPHASLSVAWVSKRALISHCFNPLLSGQGTGTWRWPTSRGGAKTKVELQELCKQKREREISLCSLRSSGLNPHNQHDKPCICGILE